MKNTMEASNTHCKYETSSKLQKPSSVLKTKDFTADNEKSASTIKKNENMSTSTLLENINGISLSSVKNETKIFDEEITQIVNQVMVSETESETLVTLIIRDVRTALGNIGFSYELAPFGSYVNGLGCKESDIDISLNSPNYVIENDQSLLYRISKNLKRSKSFSCVMNIPKARVPIIKFKHKTTKKECDLSLSNEIGVRNTYLIRYYLGINPNLKRLVLFLKILLRKYDIQGPGKITTFMLFWLVVYYMQQIDLLPPVTDVRKLAEEKYFVSEWDCSVPKHSHCPVTDPYSLYIHVIQFLKFYSDFEFMKFVISPYLACTIPVNCFADLCIPSELFSTYLKKMETVADVKFSTYIINVQDPTVHNFNLTKQIELPSLNKFKSFCFILHNFLTNDTRNFDILSKLCPVSLPLKNNPPDNCLQYFNIFWCDSKLQQHILDEYSKSGISFLCNTLTNIMENILKFEIENVFVKDLNRIYRKEDKLVQGVTPTGILTCYTNDSAWTKVQTSVGIIRQKRNTISPVHVFIVLETYNYDKQIRIFVESKANFIRFFRVYLADCFLKS